MLCHCEGRVERQKGGVKRKKSHETMQEGRVKKKKKTLSLSYINI